MERVAAALIGAFALIIVALIYTGQDRLGETPLPSGDTGRYQQIPEQDSYSSPPESHPQEVPAQSEPAQVECIHLSRYGSVSPCPDGQGCYIVDAPMPFIVPGNPNDIVVDSYHTPHESGETAPAGPATWWPQGRTCLQP